jgi:hypothetical protein
MMAVTKVCPNVPSLAERIITGTTFNQGFFVEAVYACNKLRRE